MIDIIPVDLIVHKNQAVPDILRVIFPGSVSQVSTVPASKLDQDRRSVLGKRHLLYRLAIAGVPLILRGTQVPHHLLEVRLVSTRSYVEPTVWGAIL